MKSMLQLSFGRVGVVAVAAYDYLGESRVVGVDYPEIDVMSLQYSSTPGAYPALDQFNRPVTSRWTKDLSTDRDFYNIAVSWDRGSNVTSVNDLVWPDRDASYTVDGLSRLTRTEEGTWTGSAITSRSRDELWTLTRTGNWSRNKIDLNGDGDFVDSGEQDDTQAFNDANELLTRDLDSNTSVDLTLGHDAVGNLTDDGQPCSIKVTTIMQERRTCHGTMLCRFLNLPSVIGPYTVVQSKPEFLGIDFLDGTMFVGNGKCKCLAGDWIENVRLCGG